MILLEIGDFKGFHSLAISIDNTPILQSFIDRFEESYIKRILGVELGQKFIDDIRGEDSDSSSIEPRFQAIIDPFIKQDCNRSIMESKGMRDLLAGLIYYEFVFSNQMKHTQSGATLNQSEVSDTATPQEAALFAEQKYNASLPSVYAIQWLCGTENFKDYPEFAGTYFRPKYSPLL